MMELNAEETRIPWKSNTVSSAILVIPQEMAKYWTRPAQPFSQRL